MSLPVEQGPELEPPGEGAIRFTCPEQAEQLARLLRLVGSGAHVEQAGALGSSLTVTTELHVWGIGKMGGLLGWSARKPVEVVEVVDAEVVEEHAPDCEVVTSQSLACTCGTDEQVVDASS